MPKLSSHPLRGAIVRCTVLGLILGIGGLARLKPAQGQSALPRPDHVIVVIEENHSFRQVIGAKGPAGLIARYMNELASRGASFSSFFAFHHPSQPNYLELFSGSNQQVTDDKCPKQLFTTPSLGGALLAKGLTFRGYAEDLPHVGALDCLSPDDKKKALYARKHCPWVDFADVPATLSVPLSQFPTNFTELPTVAFVIPNLLNDMHNGRDPDRITQADTWLSNHLGAYVDWAMSHNSLLVLTWDEDQHHEIPPPNQIPTIIVGAGVKAGTYNSRYTHYDLLRTIEDMYGLPHLGGSATAAGIHDVWK